jgi:phosphoesterase RecJ-like protein
LLDCSTLSRLGSLGKRLEKIKKPIAVIDHHVGSEDGDGTVNYVDSTAAATGALVRRLFSEFEVPLDSVAAEGVFLSLVSDTGWFRYSNTDAEVLTMAGELVTLGVDVGAIYDHLYRRNHPESASVLIAALQRNRFTCDGRLALVVLEKSIMERAVRIDFDTDSVLEPLRSLAGVEVVGLLKERFDGTLKLSLRARDDVDVQSICKVFGGGGHKKASGATLRIPLAEAEKAVVAEVGRALDVKAKSK